MNIANINGEYRTQLYDFADNNAISQFINHVLSDMDQLLSSRQLTELYNVLQKVIRNYSISTDEKLYEDTPYTEVNDMLLTRFIEDKRLAGLSEKTLKQYLECLQAVSRFLMKGFDSVTVDDIRDYFSYLMEEKGTGGTTVDNYRRYLNSFYNHLVSNGLLYKNPVLKIDRIKTEKKIKQAFSYTEIIYLRENLQTLRDKAIFELLLSSGIRAGELSRLDHKDLDMTNRSVIVKGKGDKEREVFFNELAKVSIQRYLESRTDTNPALFVTLHQPFNRMKAQDVTNMLRKLGERAGVNKVHAHRFRRHFATTLINKGVTIEQVQQLLGHAEIETTQMYVVLDDDEIQYNHKRYVN